MKISQTPHNNIAFASQKLEATASPAESVLLPSEQTASAPQKASSNLLKTYAGVRFASSASVTEAESIVEPTSAQLPKYMTFSDYINLVKEDPRRFLPTAKTYMLRGIESWGYQEEMVLGQNVRVYNYLNRPWLPDSVMDKDEFFGQELNVHALIETIRRLKDSKSPYVIELIGPKGTGKSAVVAVAQEAAAEFSNLPGGERYSFSFVFGKNNRGLKFLVPVPERSSGRSSTGLGKKMGSVLKDSDVSFRLPSPLDRNPIFLLSQQERGDLIKELKESGKLGEDEDFDYFINGMDLDERSRKVMETLKNYYDGDLDKVLQHIRVERIPFDKVKIPSSETPHAILTPLTREIAWERLPRSLRNIPSLFDYDGYLVKANGNMLNIDDMGRSPAGGNEFTYLLETAQTGKLTIRSNGTMQSVEEPVDIIFISSSNPESLQGMGANREAFSERSIKIFWPHDIRFSNEAQVHHSFFIKAMKTGRAVAPHAEDVYALWATMTRLVPVNANYSEYGKLPPEDVKRFNSALNKLDLLKKALLYQGVTDDRTRYDVNTYVLDPKAPKYLTKEELALLNRYVGLIFNEHRQSLGEQNEFLYEGGFGISAREGDKTLVPSIISQHPDYPITVLDVFEGIRDHLSKQPKWVGERKKFYEHWPKTAGANSAPNLPLPGELLKQVEAYSRRQFLYELGDALEVRTEEQRVQDLIMYLEHVNVLLNSDDPDFSKVPEAFRRKPDKENPDLKFIQDIEKAIYPDNPTGDRLTTSRRRFIAKVTGNLDPRASLQERLEISRRVYSKELEFMAAYDSQGEPAKERMTQFIKDLTLLKSNPNALEGIVDETRKREVETMLKAVERLQQLGYPMDALPELLEWSFSDKYISDNTWERRVK